MPNDRPRPSSSAAGRPSRGGSPSGDGRSGGKPGRAASGGARPSRPSGPASGDARDARGGRPPGSSRGRSGGSTGRYSDRDGYPGPSRDGDGRPAAYNRAGTGRRTSSGAGETGGRSGQSPQREAAVPVVRRVPRADGPVLRAEGAGRSWSPRPDGDRPRGPRPDGDRPRGPRARRRSASWAAPGGRAKPSRGRSTAQWWGPAGPPSGLGCRPSSPRGCGSGCAAERAETDDCGRPTGDHGQDEARRPQAGACRGRAASVGARAVDR